MTHSTSLSYFCRYGAVLFTTLIPLLMYSTIHRTFYSCVYVPSCTELQDHAPTVPFAEVCQVICEDFGVASHTDLFDEFDEVPIASASLAQVHRAVISTSHASKTELSKDAAGEERKAEKQEQKREVAVKIQYPRLKFQVDSDLAAMKVMLTALCYFFPDFEFRWLLPEFRVNLKRELNFTMEGRNAVRVRKLFKDQDRLDKDMYIPEVFFPFTSKRVLTMEFIHGCRVDDIKGLKARGLEPAAVARTVANVFGDMIYVHGFVHCDPHPGNLFVRRVDKVEPTPTTTHPRPHTAAPGLIPPMSPSKAQLVVLDHGLYRELDESFRSSYCLLWKSLILRNRKGKQAITGTLN